LNDTTTKYGDGFSRVFGNSFFLIANEGVKAVANLVVLAVLARHFDLETFGDYCFVFALCNIFQAMTGMGMNKIIVREIAKKPVAAGEIFDASFFVRILSGFITFAILALSINLLSSSPEVIRATYVCSVGVITLFFCNLPFSVFQGYQKMGFLTVVGVAANMTYLALIVFFVKFDARLQEIFFPSVAANLLGFLMGLCIVRKRFFVPKLKLNLRLCIYLVKESYLVGAARILRKVGFRIHTILIKMIRGSVEAGLFTGAFRPFLQLALIPNSLVMSVFPVLSARHARKDGSFDSAFKECLKIFVVLVVPLVIFLFFFAQDVVVLILGQKLIQAVPVFKVLSLAWGFMFISVLLIDTLIATGKQNLMTICIGLALGVNVTLDVLLIPAKGFMGAGVATLAAEAVLTISAYRFASRSFTSLPLRQILIGPFIGGVVLAFVCYWGSQMESFVMLFPALILGFGCYLGALILFKTLTSEEYALGKEVFRNLLLQRALKDRKMGNVINGIRGYGIEKK
jgi:O-antigen/teichoic acid export membrane protein